MHRFLLRSTAAACAALFCAGSAAGAVIISEYVEGSSNNKAVELYNTGPSAVDLSVSGFVLRIYFNGNTTPAQTLPLSGSLAAGGVRVIANPNASEEVLEKADQTFAGLLFNGNDAVVLEAGGAVVDRIGQVGFDPETEWGSGETSTANNTLRRNPAVLAGDSATAAVFDPSLQWLGFPLDTFDGLGKHAVLPIPEPQAWLLVLAGLGALAGAGRLRRWTAARASD